MVLRAGSLLCFQSCSAGADIRSIEQIIIKNICANDVWINDVNNNCHAFLYSSIKTVHVIISIKSYEINSTGRPISHKSLRLPTIFTAPDLSPNFVHLHNTQQPNLLQINSPIKLSPSQPKHVIKPPPLVINLGRPRGKLSITSIISPSTNSRARTLAKNVRSKPRRIAREAKKTSRRHITYSFPAAKFFPPLRKSLRNEKPAAAAARRPLLCAREKKLPTRRKSSVLPAFFSSRSGFPPPQQEINVPIPKG